MRESTQYIDGKKTCINEDNKYFNRKKLTIKRIKDGIILLPKPTGNGGTYYGGVCDSSGNFCAGLFKDIKKPGFFDVIDGYDVPNDINVVNDDVIFGGVIISHFGHFMLECMSRIWYVIDNPQNTNKIVFVCVHKTMASWFYEWMDLLGISKDRIEILIRNTRYKSILVPEESVHSNCEYMQEYKNIYKHMAKKLSFSPIKKVYLSRSYVCSGVFCVNEEYFERFFARKGFCIIHPEQYSVKQQAEIIYGADEVISTVGSISHWALFLRENAKLTILLRDKHIPVNQRIVNEVSNINCVWIDVSKSWLPCVPGHGAFLLGETESWRRYIEDMFGETVDTETWKQSTLDYIDAWDKLWISPGNYWQDYLYKNADAYDFMKGISDMWSGKKFNFADRKKAEKEKKIEAINNIERINYLEHLIQNILGRKLMTYRVHAGFVGWCENKYEGQTAGETQGNHDIQAIIIDSEILLSYKVYYGEGKWSREVNCGKLCGTVGKSKPIHGIAIRLIDDMEKYRVLYRLFSSEIGWSPWGKNGDNITCENKIINAIEIKITQSD